MKIIGNCRARGLVLAATLGIGLGFATHATAVDRSYLIDLNSRTATDLGSSSLIAINDSGQVIGASNGNAFITGPNGAGMTFLGHSARAFGINASGQVVGAARIDESAPERPFITGPNGVGITAIPGGSYFNPATGINASGQVIGTGTVGTSSRAFGVFAEPHGPLQYLNVRGPDTYPNAINDSGQVVGESNGGAFITGFNGVGETDLGTLGGYGSAATGINASGQVAGSSGTAAGQYHAFITGPDGVGMTDLGTLGGTNSAASGINDAGQVVGQSYAADGHGYAFITGPDGVGMSYLGALVDLPADVVLTSAADINNAGQVIVSASIVPEPESYALMLAGLALMGAAVRRKQRG